MKPPLELEWGLSVGEGVAEVVEEADEEEEEEEDVGEEEGRDVREAVFVADAEVNEREAVSIADVIAEFDRLSSSVPVVEASGTVAVNPAAVTLAAEAAAGGVHIPLLYVTAAGAASPSSAPTPSDPSSA